jgi:hypothetical protein
MKKEKLQHITKQNVLQAIERIKEEGVPSARESNTYDLVFEGVVYPPKYITSLAGYFSEKGQFIFASKNKILFLGVLFSVIKYHTM